jgi:predicted dehydrogenase
MWKNRFTFEAMGRDGYARVDGLGGTYGVETLTVGHRRTVGGVPRETITTYEQPDGSWDGDWHDLIDAIEGGHDPEVGADAGLAVMQLVDEVYDWAKSSRASIGVPSGP